MGVKKEDPVRFIEGHKRVNEIVFQELMRQLPLLTIEQSRKEYDALCEVWQLQNMPMPKALADHRLEFKVRLRQKLNQLNSRQHFTKPWERFLKGKP